MLNLRAPSVGLSWLPDFARDIVRLFKSVMDAPFRFMQTETADVDAAAIENVYGFIVDLSEGLPYFSNGTAWITFAASGVTVTAGAGLTGGGDLSANRTIDVGAGTGITVNANDVAISTNGVSDTLLRDSAALSVIGRSANSSGDPADIAAGSDHQVLRRSGTALGFGAVALNQSAAVTGTLAVTNGGTGVTTSTGTGSVVLSAGPTFTGTASFAAVAATGRGVFGGGLRATGFDFAGTTGLGGEITVGAGEVNFNSFDRTASAFAVLNFQGSTVNLKPGGTTALAVSSTGADVTGEMRCDTLRIDATATAATPTPTHTVPININGTIYRFPCVI